jgi:hypothetical protein
MGNLTEHFAHDQQKEKQKEECGSNKDKSETRIVRSLIDDDT